MGIINIYHKINEIKSLLNIEKLNLKTPRKKDQKKQKIKKKN